MIREIEQGVDDVLLKLAKRSYSDIAPYLHGDIYASKPYLMQYMENISARYLMEGYHQKVSMKWLAGELQCLIYGTFNYEYELKCLKAAAKKNGCGIDRLRANVPEYVYALGI